MDDPGVVNVDDGAAAYRGFLFADLRGYTAFGERHGDRAAADLLDAYRALVRDEVARHAGAEVRTEGDSFYIVFASARDAVACGLAIIDAADKYSREHEDAPLRIGIGINAGETVQRGQAFVGTAVNLAARLCSQARAGEVLVTASVREAARGGSAREPEDCPHLGALEDDRVRPLDERVARINREVWHSEEDRQATQRTYEYPAEALEVGRRPDVEAELCIYLAYAEWSGRGLVVRQPQLRMKPIPIDADSRSTSQQRGLIDIDSVPIAID